MSEANAFPIKLRESKRVSAYSNNHGNWAGGKWVNGPNKVVMVYAPSHPRNVHGYVPEHILIAERALGKPLPNSAVVHHMNGNPLDNSPTNLAILQDRPFHRFIHSRLKSYIATGSPEYYFCKPCGRWVHKTSFYYRNNGKRLVPCKQCDADRKKG